MTAEAPVAPVFEDAPSVHPLDADTVFQGIVQGYGETAAGPELKQLSEEEQLMQAYGNLKGLYFKALVNYGMGNPELSNKMLGGLVTAHYGENMMADYITQQDEQRRQREETRRKETDAVVYGLFTDKSEIKSKKKSSDSSSRHSLTV
jgi:hypothetical protein